MVTTNEQKPKIPPVWVASDQCLVTVGQIVENGTITNPGTAYPVHVGEWVEILPAMSVQEVVSLTSMQRIMAGSTQDATEIETAFRMMASELSKRVIAWNWTDMMGQPMSQPYAKPEVLMQLTNEELLWLVQATSGRETVEERKNASGPLPSTLLVPTTAPAPSLTPVS